MSDKAAVLDEAARWHRQGLGVAIATVVSTWGSAPRPAGSQLAVNERGEFAGSVSGGCVEAAVVHEALAVIRDGGTRLLRYGVTDERAWEVGLACGGTVQVYVERLGMTPELLDRLRRDVSGRRAVVLVTDLGSGAGRLVHPFEIAEADPAGPALRSAVDTAAARDASGQVEVEGRAVLLTVFNPTVKVVIVGAVHVAQALAPMVRLAGYEVVVVDPRRAFATEARFPGVPLLPAWPDAALPQVGLDRRTALVAVTHDPKIDDPAVAAALRSETFYVGCLGSRRTHAARRERLRAMGFGDGDLARVHGPVGLPIGAATPGEIAVSILSELIDCLRRRREQAPQPP